MKKKLAILLTAAAMCCAGGGFHKHTYTDTFVEPTVSSQGYTLHTCTCGNSYKDAFTGLSGKENSPNAPQHNVLFIGNSYTYFNDLSSIFKSIVEGQGLEITVDEVTSGGYYLYQFASPSDTHYATIESKLATGTFDVVFLQDQSMAPIKSTKFFYDGVREMNAIVKAAGAQAVLYQTWGRKPGSADLTKNGLTNESMTMKLAAGYEAIGRELDIPVSPAGSAFYMAIDSGIELYNGDMTHPSSTGSYLAALCHYAKVYGLSPIGVSYTHDLAPRTVEYLQKIAHKAVFGGSIVTDEYKTSSEGVTFG